MPRSCYIAIEHFKQAWDTPFTYIGIACSGDILIAFRFPRVVPPVYSLLGNF